MLIVQQEFSTREQEIERYFQFLRCFSEKGIKFESDQIFAISANKEELFKTLKANGFLLLYNLVESTLKNCIEAIFDEIKQRSVSFDHCRLEVRKLILKNLKKREIDNVLTSLSNLSLDVAFATFRKDELFSGNVDARLIRDLAVDYGFNPPHGKSDNLLTVKTNRNDLAHGMKSFAEVGRDFDLERLEEIMKEVISFLQSLLDSVAHYISNKSYLITSIA